MLVATDFGLIERASPHDMCSHWRHATNALCPVFLSNTSCARPNSPPRRWACPLHRYSETVPNRYLLMRHSSYSTPNCDLPQYGRDHEAHTPPQPRCRPHTVCLFTATIRPFSGPPPSSTSWHQSREIALQTSDRRHSPHRDDHAPSYREHTLPAWRNASFSRLHASSCGGHASRS